MSVNQVTMAKNVSINVRCHFTDKTAENCALINVHMVNVIISQENVQNVIQVGWDKIVPRSARQMLGVSTVRRIVSVRTVQHVPTPLATAIALMDTEVCIVPKDAHKVHLATTVVEFASAMEIMLSAASLTGIVSVYLVTMVTCVQNSVLKGHMDINVSRIVRVMKMVHDCVTTGQENASVRVVGKVLSVTLDATKGNGARVAASFVPVTAMVHVIN